MLLHSQHTDKVRALLHSDAARCKATSDLQCAVRLKTPNSLCAALPVTIAVLSATIVNTSIFPVQSNAVMGLKAAWSCDLVLCDGAGGSTGSVYVNNASIAFGAYPASASAAYQCRLEVYQDSSSSWTVQNAFAACTSPKVGHTTSRLTSNAVTLSAIRHHDSG